MNPNEKELKEERKKIGQAIDEAIEALKPLSTENRLTAIQTICNYLSIRLKPERSSVFDTGVGTPTSPEVQGVGQATATPNDIRSLKEQKRPSSDVEMLAIVAYYLAYLAPETERKETVNKDDIARYFREADYPLPEGQPRFTLNNAKNAGYFELIGSGEYKLNSVGYNLVAHRLPHESTGAAKPVSRKRPTPKKPAKKQSKATPKKK
jgi:hypothetical protein